jgi:hypothetical protein
MMTPSELVRPPAPVTPPELAMPPRVVTPPEVVTPLELATPPELAMPPRVVTPPEVVTPLELATPPELAMPPELVTPPASVVPPNVATPVPVPLAPPVPPLEDELPSGVVEPALRSPDELHAENSIPTLTAHRTGARTGDGVDALCRTTRPPCLARFGRDGKAVVPAGTGQG